MGRRSISSTKAGKFMNPTDQARKEARRKELKKNKKQRLQVRQAVIKQKDPKHLLNDMELLDKMEFDPNNPPPYSVKVIQDKRRKLKETWTKIYQFYQREDPKQAYELKQMELDYERRHQHMAYVYESIMQAQKVKLDDIPLPMGSGAHLSLAASIDLPPSTPTPPTTASESSSLTSEQQPSSLSVAPKSILKSVSTNLMQQPSAGSSSSSQFMISSTSKELLLKHGRCDENGDDGSGGVPQAPSGSAPPDLAEFECDTDEHELGLTLSDHFSKQIDKSKKIRFNETSTSTSTTAVSNLALPPPPPPPPSSSFAPPPLPPQTTIGLNTSSPYLSGKMAVQHQQQQQQQQQQAKAKASVGGGAAASTQNKPILKQQQQHHHPPSSSSSTLASTQATMSVQPAAGGKTIEAKPVLRNKIAEITRFVPTSLLVRRGATPGTGSVNDTTTTSSSSTNTNSITSLSSSNESHYHYNNHHHHQPYDYMSQQQQTYSNMNPLMSGGSRPKTTGDNYGLEQTKPTTTTTTKLASTDAAYESFMKEIGKLL